MQFTRLVTGLKSAPYIASRALQLVLNQRNFNEFLEKNVKDESIKSALKKNKLETILVA